MRAVVEHSTALLPCWETCASQQPKPRYSCVDAREYASEMMRVRLVQELEEIRAMCCGAESWHLPFVL